MKTKMTPAEVMAEYLDIDSQKAAQIMVACDTTLDGSKWDSASFIQIIWTAKAVNKALAKVGA